MYIDSHCHLIHKRLKHLGDPAQIVQNAADAGVDAMLSVCCNINEEMGQLTELAAQFDNVWCSVGTHPHDAGVEEEKAISQDKLVELVTSDPNIIAIGESGLDYFYKHSPIEDQQEAFRKHIRACKETGLPLIIHSRDADDDLINIVKEEGLDNLKAVMHCFSSSRELGEAALEFGFYISFSGIITFKKSQELRDFARDVPLDKLLIETDAPFLAPEPHRGAINEPAFVPHTCAVLADLHDISAEKMAQITSDNFFTLFDKAEL